MSQDLSPHTAIADLIDLDPRIAQLGGQGLLALREKLQLLDRYLVALACHKTAMEFGRGLDKNFGDIEDFSLERLGALPAQWRAQLTEDSAIGSFPDDFLEIVGTFSAEANGS